ncbi:hypothetical protein KEM56_002980, partial [Ascosphaera pollenicola]
TGLQSEKVTSDLIQRGGRLFQQYVVDVWAAIDDARLRWAELNQKRVRADIRCKFGVEATAAHSNADYHVGAQDITDIVQDAIKKFAGGDRIGAKGAMNCNGNTHQKESVTWGLYA